MVRSISFLLGAALAAAPVAASNYSASLGSPVTGRFITRDISWVCGEAACQGATDESRPLVLCQSLAKRVGRIETFLTDGHAMTSDDLQRCNAFAPAAARADRLSRR